MFSIDFTYVLAPKLCFGTGSGTNIEGENKEGLELENRKPHQQETASPLAATSPSVADSERQENDDRRLFKDLVLCNREAYELAVWTAVIYPVRGSDNECVYSDSELRLRQYWVTVAHISVVLYCIFFLANVTFVLFVYDLPSAERMLLSLQWLAGIVPVTLMVPAMTMIRRNLFRPIPLVYSSTDTVDTIAAVYKEASLYAAGLGRRLLYLFYTLLTAQLLLQTVEAAKSQRPTPLFRALIIIDVILSLLSHFPPVAMLLGIFALVVVEQRVSYSFMINLRAKALTGELTDELYVETGRNFEERDKQSPIDFILLAAGCDTVACVTVMLLLGFSNQFPAEDVMYNVFYVVVIFGNEVVIFLLLLVEVLRVNEMVDVLLDQTSRQLLSSRTKSNVAFDRDTHSVTVRNADVSPEERRIRRLELYLIMKEYRIGSRILFYRPNKMQLILQITSIAVGLITSALKVAVKAITGG